MSCLKILSKFEIPEVYGGIKKDIQLNYSTKSHIICVPKKPVLFGILWCKQLLNVKLQ